MSIAYLVWQGFAGALLDQKNWWRRSTPISCLHVIVCDQKNPENMMKYVQFGLS
jgi:hypothetical protein